LDKDVLLVEIITKRARLYRWIERVHHLILSPVLDCLRRSKVGSVVWIWDKRDALPPRTVVAGVSGSLSRCL
jgi:hypothetical protein